MFDALWFSTASCDTIQYETATRGTLIFICNWAEYQENSETPATQMRHSRDTDATQIGHGSDTDRTRIGHGSDLIGELKKERRNTFCPADAAY